MKMSRRGDGWIGVQSGHFCLFPGWLKQLRLLKINNLAVLI